ncbi:MAG TPA: efflux RND transporter periplasmic adaptor subunit [Nitrospira sp.]|nr:efflux RND transporter periplasmic adaptor subunit [Nitrospira sp.]
MNIRLMTFAGCLWMLLAACHGQDDQAVHAAAHDDSPPIVRVSPKALQEIQIQAAEPRPLSRQLVVQGRIQYTPDRYANMTSPMGGLVQAVHGKLGEPVRKDQSLVTIQSPDIIAAYAQLTEAESDRDLARRTHAMILDLYRAKALSKKDLEQAENTLRRASAEYDRVRERLIALRVPPEELDQPPATRHITGRFDLRSPFDGVIVEKKVSVGQIVDSSEVLYTVANMDVLQAVGEIYERTLRLITPGLPVVVAVESSPDERFGGVVTYVGDVVDPTSRTIKIRCDIDNAQHKLKADMHARIQIEIPSADEVIAVPRKAVIRLADKSFVFVQRAPEEYERREVILGPASGDLVEIRHGLEKDEHIAVTGTLLLEGELEKHIS